MQDREGAVLLTAAVYRIVFRCIYVDFMASGAASGRGKLKRMCPVLCPAGRSVCEYFIAL